MPHEGGTRAEILPGCPSLDRESRVAEVVFEPRTLRLSIVLGAQTDYGTEPPVHSVVFDWISTKLVVQRQGKLGRSPDHQH
ncbi:hypothetical protein T265_13326, partial [Opisthorchis viverrini]